MGKDRGAGKNECVMQWDGGVAQTSGQALAGLSHGGRADARRAEMAGEVVQRYNTRYSQVDETLEEKQK